MYVKKQELYPTHCFYMPFFMFELHYINTIIVFRKAFRNVTYMNKWQPIRVSIARPYLIHKFWYRVNKTFVEKSGRPRVGRREGGCSLARRTHADRERVKKFRTSFMYGPFVHYAHTFQRVVLQDLCYN